MKRISKSVRERGVRGREREREREREKDTERERERERERGGGLKEKKNNQASDKHRSTYSMKDSKASRNLALKSLTGKTSIKEKQ